MVMVKESNHFGAAGIYGRWIARAGMVGLVMTSAAARVAPYGGCTPLVGTNPICIAAPGAGDDLFCLDMATSQISYSAVKHQMRLGAALADGCIVDGEGLPCNHPEPAGALTPLGGYKGQGLGMAVEILRAVLLGLPLDHELEHFDDLSARDGRRIGHLLLAIDPAATIGLGPFASGVSTLLAHVRQSPSANDTAVRVAGDPEALTARDRFERGIPMSHGELAALRRLASPEGRAAAAPVR